MTYIDVGKSNLIYNLNPLVVVLLSKCMLGENVTKWDVLLSIGAFIGVFVVSDVSGTTSVERREMIGAGLALLSAITTGLQFLLIRKLNEKAFIHHLLQPYLLAIIALLTAIITFAISPKSIDLSAI